MTFLGIGEVAVNEETFNNGVLIEIDNSGNSMGMVREYTIKGNNQFNYKSIGKIDLKEILSKKTSKEVDEELKAQIDNLHCKEPIYFSKEFINFVNFAKELINNE